MKNEYRLHKTVKIANRLKDKQRRGISGVLDFKVLILSKRRVNFKKLFVWKALNI